MDSLSYLHPDSNALADRLDQLVDDMIVVGDLLELSDVATDDPKVKGTWVFARHLLSWFVRVEASS